MPELLRSGMWKGVKAVRQKKIASRTPPAKILASDRSWWCFGRFCRLALLALAQIPEPTGAVNPQGQMIVAILIAWFFHILCDLIYQANFEDLLAGVILILRHQVVTVPWEGELLTYVWKMFCYPLNWLLICRVGLHVWYEGKMTLIWLVTRLGWHFFKLLYAFPGSSSL